MLIRLALELATAGFAVFPCRSDKRPACSNGYKDASTDPDLVRVLFQRYHASLIGVATGAVSGIDVVDLDARGGATGWWHVNRHRFPRTRVHRTRSGGLHVPLQHADGVRNSASKIAPGVDVRGDGGYVIWWPAAGLPVLDDADPAPWPPWLLETLQPSPRPAMPPRHVPMSASEASKVRRYAVGALRRAVERVATAPDGMRNDTLNAECWAMMRLVPDGLAEAEIASALAIAAQHAGLSITEVERTIISAMNAARAS